jgi:hypothetical protein
VRLPVVYVYKYYVNEVDADPTWFNTVVATLSELLHRASAFFKIGVGHRVVTIPSLYERTTYIELYPTFRSLPLVKEICFTVRDVVQVALKDDKIVAERVLRVSIKPEDVEDLEWFARHRARLGRLLRGELARQLQETCRRLLQLLREVRLPEAQTQVVIAEAEVELEEPTYRLCLRVDSESVSRKCTVVDKETFTRVVEKSGGQRHIYYILSPEGQLRYRVKPCVEAELDLPHLLTAYLSGEASPALFTLLAAASSQLR